MRSAHQLAEIVAGHVLDDRAAGLHHAAVGHREVDANQQVARRAVPMTQRAAVVGGDHAADGRRVERAYRPAAIDDAARAPGSVRERWCRLRPWPSGRHAHARARGSAGACRSIRSTGRRPAAPAELGAAAAQHDRHALARRAGQQRRQRLRRGRLGDVTRLHAVDRVVRDPRRGLRTIAGLQDRRIAGRKGEGRGILQIPVTAGSEPFGQAGRLGRVRAIRTGHFPAQPRRRENLSGIAEIARIEGERARAASRRGPRP